MERGNPGTSYISHQKDGLRYIVSNPGPLADSFKSRSENHTPRPISRKLIIVQSLVIYKLILSKNMLLQFQKIIIVNLSQNYF